MERQAYHVPELYGRVEANHYFTAGAVALNCSNRVARDAHFAEFALPRTSQMKIAATTAATSTDGSSSTDCSKDGVIE
jgi:hypothetical protein